MGIGKGSWTASQHQGPDARPQSAALSTALMIGPMIWAIQLSWSRRRKSRHCHSLQGTIVKCFRGICSILKSIKSYFAKNKEVEGRHMVPGIAACCSIKQSVVSDPGDSVQYTLFISEVTHTLSENLAFTLPLFSFCTLSYQLPSSKPNVENNFSATVMTWWTKGHKTTSKRTTNTKKSFSSLCMRFFKRKLCLGNFLVQM